MIEREFQEVVLENLLDEGVITLEEYNGSSFVIPAYFDRKTMEKKDVKKKVL